MRKAQLRRRIVTIPGMFLATVLLSLLLLPALLIGGLIDIRYRRPFSTVRLIPVSYTHLRAHET